MVKVDNGESFMRGIRRGKNEIAGGIRMGNKRLRGEKV